VTVVYSRDYTWTLGKGVLYSPPEKSGILCGNHIYIVRFCKLIGKIVVNYIENDRIKVILDEYL
jgi:hypothetical protein